MRNTNRNLKTDVLHDSYGHQNVSHSYYLEFAVGQIFTFMTTVFSFIFNIWVLENVGFSPAFQGGEATINRLLQLTELFFFSFSIGKPLDPVFLLRR